MESFELIPVVTFGAYVTGGQCDLPPSASKQHRGESFLALRLLSVLSSPLQIQDKGQIPLQCLRMYT
jgi:hypothetical protein